MKFLDRVFNSPRYSIDLYLTRLNDKQTSIVFYLTAEFPEEEVVYDLIKIFADEFCEFLTRCGAKVDVVHTKFDKDSTVAITMPNDDVINFFKKHGFSSNGTVTRKRFTSTIEVDNFLTKMFVPNTMEMLRKSKKIKPFNDYEI